MRFLRILTPVSAAVLALTFQTACSSDGDDDDKGSGGSSTGGSAGEAGDAGKGGASTGGSAGNANGGTMGGTSGAGGGSSDCDPPCTGEDVCTFCMGPDGDGSYACIPPNISCSP
jgi:hypothetical protein